MFMVLYLARAEIFPLSTMFRLALDPSQPPVYWIEGTHLLGWGVKGARAYESARSPPSAAVVRICGVVLPFLHMSLWLGV
jgi:hypothetical protein